MFPLGEKIKKKEKEKKKAECQEGRSNPAACLPNQPSQASPLSPTGENPECGAHWPVSCPLGVHSLGLGCQRQWKGHEMCQISIKVKCVTGCVGEGMARYGVKGLDPRSAGGEHSLSKAFGVERDGIKGRAPGRGDMPHSGSSVCPGVQILAPLCWAAHGGTRPSTVPRPQRAAMRAHGKKSSE